MLAGHVGRGRAHACAPGCAIPVLRDGPCMWGLCAAWSVGAAARACRKSQLVVIDVVMAVRRTWKRWLGVWSRVRVVSCVCWNRTMTNYIAGRNSTTRTTGQQVTQNTDTWHSEWLSQARTLNPARALKEPTIPMPPPNSQRPALFDRAKQPSPHGGLRAVCHESLLIIRMAREQDLSVSGRNDASGHGKADITPRANESRSLSKLPRRARTRHFLVVISDVT